jgi:hypothetical protein
VLIIIKRQDKDGPRLVYGFDIQIPKQDQPETK